MVLSGVNLFDGVRFVCGVVNSCQRFMIQV